MDRSITPSLTSTVSSNSARDISFAHYALLLCVGVLLAGLHQGWDAHLSLPGHFGLIWMAGIMLTRQRSSATWAASVAALGYAGGTAAFAGFVHHGLLQAPLYALSTLVVDLAWRVDSRRSAHLFGAALLGGLAFMLKPLALVAFSHGISLNLTALRLGPVFPLLTHFSFGAVGAIIGTLLARAGSTALRTRD